MMSLANPGVLGTLALVLAGALLLMMHRTRWLRLHEADSSLSTAAIGIRVAAVGLPPLLARGATGIFPLGIQCSQSCNDR